MIEVELVGEFQVSGLIGVGIVLIDIGWGYIIVVLEIQERPAGLVGCYCNGANLNGTVKRLAKCFVTLASGIEGVFTGLEVEEGKQAVVVVVYILGCHFNAILEQTHGGTIQGEPLVVRVGRVIEPAVFDSFMHVLDRANNLACALHGNFEV